MVEVQLVLGLIYLDLEGFEEAQKNLQSSFASHKAFWGVKDERTMTAYLWVAMAARLAGNLQDAKEILETAEDPEFMLGNKTYSMSQTVIDSCYQAQ